MSYDAEDEVISGEICPSCSGTETLLDCAFGFWKCETCGTVWEHEVEDPIVLYDPDAGGITGSQLIEIVEQVKQEMGGDRHD